MQNTALTCNACVNNTINTDKCVYQPNTQDILFLLQPCMEIVFYCHFEKALI